MKGKTLLIIIALVIFGSLVFFMPKNQPTGKTVTFNCDGGKTIVTSFYAGSSTPAAAPGEPPQPGGSVDLALSDGRVMTLSQTISADGGRYANADESFIFWNKGDTAFVIENGTTTFNNCVILTTYTASSYGFTISYPQDLTPENNFNQYYHLPASWRAAAGPDSTGTPILAIPVFRIDQGGIATGKPYPLYFDAEVRIGASANPQDITNCLQSDAGYTNQKTTDTTINGIAFKKFDFASAGMMQYLRGESYRTIHNGLCFAVEQIETDSSYRDPSMLPGIPDDVLQSYYDTAGNIIQNFKFIK